MLELVENDFNVVKNNNSLLRIEEDNEVVTDASLTLLTEEFEYMEIFV